MKKLIKKWWFWAIIIVLIVFIFLYILYSQECNLENYKESVKYLKSENNRIQIMLKKLSDENTKLKKVEEKDKIEKEIKDLEKNKNIIQGDIKKITTEKASLEKELKKIEKNIVIAKGKAKTYPAGYLTAGKDFEVGRYKIYGGSSNFSVHSLSGNLRVNIILGDYGVDEYIYTFSHGDEVHARSYFKMQSIE